MAAVWRSTLLAALAVLISLSSIGRGDEPLPKGPAATGDKSVVKKPAKATAKPQRIVQVADGSVMLAARDATVHGSTVRYEPEKDTIGYWTKAADYVSWDLAIVQPGRFIVELYQSSGQGDAGSEYTVEIGDQTLTGRVQDTASFRNFRRRTVGTVELKEPGRYTLAVRPQAKPGLAVMDLRWVKLTPVPPEKKDSPAAPTPGKSGSERPSAAPPNSAGPGSAPSPPSQAVPGK